MARKVRRKRPQPAFRSVLYMMTKDFVKAAQHTPLWQRREASFLALVVLLLACGAHRAAAQTGPRTPPEALPKNSASAQIPPAARDSGSKVAEASGAPTVIIYEDGKLTVIAEDRALSEVLAGIRQAMGADINIPAGAAGQRVWVRFGPGPARRILRDLLDSTELDYVIQASELDVDGVRSVSLTARGKLSDGGETASQLVRSASRKPVPAGTPPESPELEAAPVPEETAANAKVTPAAADAVSAKDVAPPQASPVSFGAGAPASGGTSADQMAQQLQNMYQQRRQIQIQQNQKPPVIN
jgi:hypothetical protein